MTEEVMPTDDGKNEWLEFQVVVPVCVTLRLRRYDAEWMCRDDLAQAAGAVLEEAASEDEREVSPIIDCGPVPVKWKMAPYWDNLPEDECDLVFEEEADLFPVRN